MNMFSKLKSRIIFEVDDFKMLLRHIPPITLVLATLSVILMNLFANKEFVNYKYLALDCGFLVSWMSFLAMDMLTRRFGARATIKVAYIGIFFNLLCAALFKLIAICNFGNWGEFYTLGTPIANEAINNTFGGNWYVLFGSTVAYACSSIINCTINQALGKLFKGKSFKEYTIRSYVSTIVGQIADNLLFAFIVSTVLFGWTLSQCIACSIVGAVFELLSEVIFSPIGYRVCKRWEKEKIGESYIRYAVQHQLR